LKLEFKTLVLVKHKVTHCLWVAWWGNGNASDFRLEGREGFRHVQHFRPNTRPTKRGPHKSTNFSHFCNMV